MLQHVTQTTPLLLATFEGHLEIVRYLLSLPDIDVNIKVQVRDEVSLQMNVSDVDIVLTFS